MTIIIKCLVLYLFNLFVLLFVLLPLFFFSSSFHLQHETPIMMMAYFHVHCNPQLIQPCLNFHHTDAKHTLKKSNYVASQITQVKTHRPHHQRPSKTPIKTQLIEASGCCVVIKMLIIPFRFNIVLGLSSDIILESKLQKLTGFFVRLLLEIGQ